MHCGATILGKNKKFAFTLAEVLITLGIIGVVAAMTLPTLVQNYRKHVVETRLMKFYSVMNNAFALSVAHNGDLADWAFQPQSSVENGKYTNIDSANTDRLEWLKKYLVPYLKITKIESTPVTLAYGKSNQPAIYFPDGSALVCTHEVGVQDWNFYPEIKKINLKIDTYRGQSGKDFFRFNIQGVGKCKGYFTPYCFTLSENDEKDGYKSKCLSNPSYCTAAIMYNGWKIPDWYPYKF